MPLFEELHPDCELLIAFDNSQNHHKRAPDGLDADEMNLSAGGRKRTMRNTRASLVRTVVAAEGVVQQLVPDQLQVMVNNHGEPKGLRTVLMERGLWRDGMLLECNSCKRKDSDDERQLLEQAGVFGGRGRNFCCARGVMRKQPDFVAQREWLREVVENKGHKIIYYPKYHCELNYIEMVWAYLKAYVRRHCTYSFRNLVDLIPVALDSIDVKFVRRAMRKCLRYMDGYRHELQGPLLDYAVKKYKHHRKIPGELLKEVKTEFDIKLAAKSKQRYQDHIAQINA